MSLWDLVSLLLSPSEADWLLNWWITSQLPAHKSK